MHSNMLNEKIMMAHLDDETQRKTISHITVRESLQKVCDGGVWNDDAIKLFAYCLMRIMEKLDADSQ